MNIQHLLMNYHEIWRRINMNYEQFLLEYIPNNPEFIVLTAENRAAIRNLPNVLTKNFVDTGITEQSLVGISAGLALRGRKPIAHALAAFLTMRAFEFIRTDLGYGNLPVKIVGSFAGFLSEANGPTHQAIEDIGLMRMIPNMQVFAPADEEDMIKMLPKILKTNSPAYIRYNNLPSTINHTDFEIGIAEIIGNGNDVSILTYGTLFSETLKVKEYLENQDINCTIVNFRTLKPIDKDIILELARQSKLLVTIEDHFINSGLYSIVCNYLFEHKFVVDVLPIGLNERWFKPLMLQDILEYEKFDYVSISNQIINKLSEIK